MGIGMAMPWSKDVFEKGYELRRDITFIESPLYIYSELYNDIL